MKQMTWQELTEALFNANNAQDFSTAGKIVAEMKKRPEQRARKIRFSVR
jgi:hypothetical protein